MMISKDDRVATTRNMRSGPGAVRHAAAKKEAEEMEADPNIVIYQSHRRRWSVLVSESSNRTEQYSPWFDHGAISIKQL